MKRTVTVLCALFFAGSLAAVAAETKSDKPAAKPAKVTKTTLKAETGTRVARTIRVQGQITDAPYHLIIIDNEAIRRSGASTVAQLLAQQGVRR